MSAKRSAPTPVSEIEPKGAASRRKQAVAKITSRGLVFTAAVIVAMVVLASAVGVEASHALSSPSGDPTVSSTAPSVTGTAAGSNPGDSTTTGSADGSVESDAPVFLKGAGYSPGHGAFDAVDCDTTTHCLAVGADGLGHGVIARSSDGGSTWGNQTVATTTPPLNAVSCGNATHCVAVGQGSIDATTDGGATWHLHAPPAARTTLLGVHCSSATTCISVGVATPAVSGPYEGKTFISTDSGATWKAVTLSAGTLGIGAIACPTALHCISVGAQVMNSLDGGVTWTPVAVAGGTPALTSISCSGPLHCVAVGPNPGAITDGTASALVVVTHDGGLSWSNETMPPSTASLDEVACALGSQCFLSGPAVTSTGPAPVLTTSDGGDSWQSAPTPGGLTAIAGIACPAENHCVVVGRNKKQPEVDTTSTGSAWSTQTLPMSVVTGPQAVNTSGAS